MASERTTKKSSSATSPRSGRQQQQHQVVVMETGNSSVGAEQMIHVISPPLPGTSGAGSQGAVTLPIALAQGGLTIPVSFTTSQNSVSKLSFFHRMRLRTEGLLLEIGVCVTYKHPKATLKKHSLVKVC